jgi:hypothetical protein
MPAGSADQRRPSGPATARSGRTHPERHTPRREAPV